MLIASRFKNQYELGDKIVIPIDKEEYDELSNICAERKYIDSHGFIIISLDSGFSQEEIDKIKERIKVYYNDNKMNLRITQQED